MGNLFGRKKQSRVTEQDRAILQLKQQRDKLRQYQKRVTQQLERERALARQLLRDGRKERAKLLLKKKRYREQLLDRTENQISSLEAMVQSIEFTQIEMKVMEGLQVGNECLNKMHQVMSIEEVERILDETQEAVEYQRQIDELLAGNFTQEDEDAILEELNEITQEQIQLPEVPSEPLPDINPGTFALRVRDLGPPGPRTMSLSRSEEMHRLTENVYKTIMEQFNPSLRNFIAMGKNYEKALAGVTFAAKGYFDALVKMGELASESQGSKELGDVLFQMAEVHRQIQNQLEEMLKSFHNELLTQLEQKVELDSRYLSAALKKYQTEQRSKGDALDKCQAELKKLRKKSQGSKNPQKYSDKELQYIDAISNKQGELENYVSDGYKTALTEERRRFCFLVEKQCAVAKNSAAYHSK
ncbi:hypothetical protein STEG23_033985, partial [Scotinomys teguina]